MKRTKQSEEKYRVMFENSPISIWEEDFSAVKRFFDSLRSDGITNIREYLNNHPEQVSKCAALVKIIDVNQATLQLYGMKDQEDLISNLTFVFTQESLPAFRGELTALAEGHTTFECEAITQSLDGRRIPIELKLNVLPGYEETLAKVIVSIIDLSKHKAMEEALLRSEVNFTKAFHSNPNLMLITKPLLDGLIIDINQTAVQALGFDYEEMIGKTTIELNLWARPERRDELLRILAKQGSFHNEEIQVRTKSGEIIIGLFSAETIELNNQPHLIAIASDITERKKAERILEKQKNELSEFAHIMAHDLKNSLLSIEGYCDLLQTDYDQDIARKIQHLAKKMNGFLRRSVALADAGRIIEETEEINLKQIVQEVAEITVPESVNLILDDDLPTAIGDHEKLTQVFQNLFENAITHGNPKKIEVRFSALDNGTAILIKNDGIQISGEHRSEIFRRGYTTKEGNQGLGLTIVQRILEAHGWKICLDDSPETTFRIIIPAKSRFFTNSGR